MQEEASGIPRRWNSVNIPSLQTLSFTHSLKGRGIAFARNWRTRNLWRVGLQIVRLGHEQERPLRRLRPSTIA